MATYVSQGVYSTDNAGVVAPPAKGGERQDLWDVVTRIDPADAPLMNNSPKSTGTAVIHDWTVQELGAASTTAIAEGADASGDTALPADRLFNYMTIRSRNYKVSDTMDSVSHAGHAAMSIRQRTLKALEVRIDVETALWGNVAKDGADPRECAGVPTWIANASGGTGFSAATGDGSDTVTVGTGGSLTLAAINALMQQAYTDGGQPNLMYFTPAQKAAFSLLSGAGNEVAAQNRFNMTQREPATFIGAVDIYLTDFGTLEAVIDRFITLESVTLIDNRHIGFVSLRGRNFKNEELAKVGDSDRGLVVSEFTLRMNAPKAHGAHYVP